MSSAFWAMGGYAYFVWSSFGLTFAVLAWNVLAPGARRRALLRMLSEREGDERDAGSARTAEGD